MSGDGAPLLISVDWGTTSLRCMLVDGSGDVQAQTRSNRGILKTDGQAFGDVLFGEIAPWLERFADGARVPVLLSGMIGSRQGWQEAAYLRCPASPADLARGLLEVDTTGTSLSGCDVRIVPGMDIVGDDEGTELPDVMRGEETQVFGALLGEGLNDGMFVLPGTHSKWVRVDNGVLTEFQTYMTGEVYAALLDATILGRLAQEDLDNEDGFKFGVETAAVVDNWAGPGQLLNMIFTARSRVLHGELEETAVRSYLSGLLIGAEMLSGIASGDDLIAQDDGGESRVRVIGDEALQVRYMKAASMIGVEIKPAIENPVPIAHLTIAQLARIVS